MSKQTVTAVTALGLAHSTELPSVVSSILTGTSTADRAAEHFLLVDEAGATPHELSRYGQVVDSAGDLAQLVRAAAESEHLILGVAGSAPSPLSAMSRFIECCYDTAKWLSLAELSASDGLDACLPSGEDPHGLKFLVPRRPLSDEHKGLVALCPPAATSDHDDPFSENTFFVLEELLRLLGFMPAGRVLATGLFDPPLEANPILQRQVLQIGRCFRSEECCSRAR